VVWVDREGHASPLWGERRNYSEPAISPDGGRIALSIETDGNWDVWVLDLDRQVATRLTFEAGEDVSPVWSPDGAWIAFSSQRGGTANLYRKAADGSGEAVRLTESSDQQYPGSWSADGHLLAFMQQDSGTLWDLWLLPSEEGGEPRPFLATAFIEVDPRISPDGRWVAYSSEESGRPEVYVRALASDQGKWQVSSGQGVSPAWSADGSELFFRSLDGSMQVVQVETGAPTFRAGRPQPLFTGDFTYASSVNYYAVAPDGQHFVMFRGEEGQARESHDQVRLVLGWLDELDRSVGSR
jgi:Tol biopolymer transport system component